MKTKRLSDKALKECADLPWMQRSWGNPCDAARDALAYRRALRRIRLVAHREGAVITIIDRALGAKR